MRKSFNIFAAVTVTALAFSLVGQPANAAIFTWQAPANGTWQTGSNWVGGSAPLAGDELVFGAAGVGSTRTASNSTANFIVNGLSFTGTTNYTISGSSIELRGDITNSANLLNLNLPVTTNKGSTVNIVTSGTIQSTSSGGYITSPDGLALSGGGKWILRAGLTGDLSTAAGTTLDFNPTNQSIIQGDLTANGITRFGLGKGHSMNSFTAGASSQTFLGVENEFTSYVGLNQGDLGATATFGGLLSLDFAAIDIDPASLTNGTQIPLFENTGGTTALTYAENFSSLVATGTSTTYPTQYGPLVGAWTLDGGNWKSPNIANGASPAQYFEFQPSIGALVVVPEPTQMVFVAGVAAAFGAWRMRKLRRNARGSDATAC
jgi:hypothetical protein